MKTYLIAFSLLATFSAYAAAKSPAEVISEFARSCFKETATQISIGLSQAYHGAKPGSEAEKRARKALDNFNQDVSDFPAFETGCNEALDGDERFTCHSQGYAAETRRLARKELLKTIPECAYLDAAGLQSF